MRPKLLKVIVVFEYIFSEFKAVSQVVLFVITIIACDLRYIFSYPTVNASSKVRANIFSILVLLLI